MFGYKINYIFIHTKNESTYQSGFYKSHITYQQEDLMNLETIKHEILGEGYYFLDANNKLMLITKNYYKLVKKILKRGYTPLTKNELDFVLKDLISTFLSKINTYTIAFLNTNKIITNILYLWYDNGFCHYKIFENGDIAGFAVSAPIMVNRSNEKIDNYLKLQKVDYYAFGDFIINDKIIYDEDLEKLYKMYGDTGANN